MKPRGRQRGSLARFTCCVCGKVESVRGGSHRFRCTECVSSMRFPPLKVGYHAYGLGGDYAGSKARSAVRSGALAHPTTCKCVDCGADATQYDHRDYNYPLVVEPVCRSCNSKRGPAIPVSGRLARVIEKGRVPYARKVFARKLLVMCGADPAITDNMPKRLEIEHWRAILSELIGIKGAPKVREAA